MKSKSLMCFAVIAFAIPALALKQDPEYRQARHEGAEAKFELRVVDDDDVPVEGATVKVFMGMNYREKGYWLTGETNTNGVWVLQGKTCGNEIEIGITKDGYYDSNRKMSLATMGAEHEVKDGKWQPWGKEERIVLRKIKNPIALECRELILQVPATNKWVGFDMCKGSFVHPYGEGRDVDFEIYVKWDGLSKTLSKYCEMEVLFPGKGNGFYIVSKMPESDYANVMGASSINGYDKSSLKWAERKDGEYLRGNSIWNEFDAVVRLRSKWDEQGKLIFANYADLRTLEVSPSKRGCPLLNLSYVFNPTLNDMNLELKR